MSEMMRDLNSQGFDILAIRPQGTLLDNGLVPENLVSIDKFSAADASNTRSFRLSMGSGQRSGEDRGPGRGARNGLGGGYGGGNHSISGRKMSANYVNARIPLGSIEIWELSNNSPMMHPFHVHNGQFQILDRGGQPPALNEQGWKDTVKVRSGEELRIIMGFSDFSDSENPYMFHCHILEHEDLGMMGQFLVVDE
jgi:FtsP/CotA-like multicopper oxidase with cupredoxin domain